MNFIDSNGSGTPVKFIKGIAPRFRSLFYILSRLVRSHEQITLQPPLMPPSFFHVFETLANPPRQFGIYKNIDVSFIDHSLLLY